MDAVQELHMHSKQDSKSTYAYYFNELYEAPAGLLSAAPAWLKKSADHADELPFVFGMAYVEEPEIWKGKVPTLMEICNISNVCSYYRIVCQTPCALLVCIQICIQIRFRSNATCCWHTYQVFLLSRKTSDFKPFTLSTYPPNLKWHPHQFFRYVGLPRWQVWADKIMLFTGGYCSRIWCVE